MIAALVAGVVAGYGIAIPVGAIAILIVETGLRRGFRLAAAAGIYATVAVVFGPRWLQQLITPAWRLLTPAAGRPARICTESATHPKMMELLDSEWNSRKQVEFAFYRMVVRAAWRRLPKRLMLEPMAYNRYRYEQLRDFHNKYELESFATVRPATGCPR